MDVDGFVVELDFSDWKIFGGFRRLEVRLIVMSCYYIVVFFEVDGDEIFWVNYF